MTLLKKLKILMCQCTCMSVSSTIQTPKFHLCFLAGATTAAGRWKKKKKYCKIQARTHFSRHWFLRLTQEWVIVVADALRVHSQAACPWFDLFFFLLQASRCACFKQNHNSFHPATAPFTFKTTEGRKQCVSLQAATAGERKWAEQMWLIWGWCS